MRKVSNQPNQKQAQDTMYTKEVVGKAKKNSIQAKKNSIHAINP